MHPGDQVLSKNNNQTFKITEINKSVEINETVKNIKTNFIVKNVKVEETWFTISTFNELFILKK